MKHYLALTKPRITWLILMSTGIGYFFGLRDWNAWVLFHTIVGTALIASGTAALNQWYERDADAQMLRTRMRPLPAGEISASRALWFGIALSVAGFVELAWGANLLTGLLGLFTLGTYLFLYTPLKRRSPHSTTIGAIPGAMPPMIGYAAAANSLGPEAWILFTILFLWQFPHFYAIAWMYRDDYARAGIRMLPVVEPDGESTARRMVWIAALLVPVSLLPAAFSMTGRLYLLAALALGIYFLHACWQIRAQLTNLGARKVLMASIAYLPLLYVALLGGCAKSPARELPAYYQLPSFTFTAESGRLITSADLQGKVWVASFIFTNCTTHCPRISGVMTSLQRETTAQLITFTVDPDQDTPAVLARYAQRYQADPARWQFLSGPREMLRAIREEAFKLGEMGSPFAHSTRFVLVDRNLRIRGFYDSADSESVARLKADIALLSHQ